MLPDQLYGFDAAGDGDLSVVVLRRDGDHWRVESTDGPHHRDLSRVVARIAGEPPPRPSAVDDRPWAEVVDEWMAKHQGTALQLTDEQREIVQATFKRLLAEGKLTLSAARTARIYADALTTPEGAVVRGESPRS